MLTCAYDASVLGSQWFWIVIWKDNIIARYIIVRAGMEK